MTLRILVQNSEHAQEIDQPTQITQFFPFWSSWNRKDSTFKGLLKMGVANLLAGRAFVFNLFPLTVKEIGKDFNLKDLLEFGSLPQVINYKKDFPNATSFLLYNGKTHILDEGIKIRPWEKGIKEIVDLFKQPL